MNKNQYKTLTQYGMPSMWAQTGNNWAQNMANWSVNQDQTDTGTKMVTPDLVDVPGTATPPPEVPQEQPVSQLKPFEQGIKPLGFFKNTSGFYPEPGANTNINSPAGDWNTKNTSWGFRGILG